ncbi:MAG: CoA pyrophosphatase [Planctomycetota bacterium]|nr:CoA pyrophosphatase [Planctomycetota bacterium]
MNASQLSTLANDRELPKKIKSFLLGEKRNSESPQKAQRQMAPELAFGRHRGPAPRNAHRAAVLISLTPRNFVAPETKQERFEWTIPLTVRARGLHDHGGQIALPGGRLEPGEESWEAARREYREELFSQVDSAKADASLREERSVSKLEYLGPLSPIYVYASNNQVDVIVAAETTLPDYSPSSDEVDQVLLVPLSFLMREDACIIGTMSRGSTTFEAPGYRFGEHFIWGATAMILAELIYAVRQAA